MDYSQMTDEQLAERTATKVMGWHKQEKGVPIYEAHEYPDGYIFCSDWQPCTDLNQAVMVADKWKKVAEERNIAIVYTWSGYHVQLRVGNKIVGESKVNDNLARALVIAVLMAEEGR